jgi:hypothetical protein
MKLFRRGTREIWWFGAGLALALFSAPWQPGQADARDDAVAAQALLEWLDSEEPAPIQPAATSPEAPASASRAGGKSTVMQVP